jgi:tRNA G18 (ribose-2'-O)-methylase SpoU
VSLEEVPLTIPTVLVLGNEGHGIRTNILRRCTHLVRIGPAKASAAPASDEQSFTVSTIGQGLDGAESMEAAVVTEGDLSRRAAAEVLAEGGAVDSLNVSVAGAIIMHHFLSGKE